MLLLYWPHEKTEGTAAERTVPYRGVFKRYVVKCFLWNRGAFDTKRRGHSCSGRSLSGSGKGSGLRSLPVLDASHRSSERSFHPRPGSCQRPYKTPWLGSDLPDYLPPMYGIAWTLDKVYSRIKSGKFWSDNTDDYFDMVAWHSYQMSTDSSLQGGDLFLQIREPDNLWKDYNDAAYRVMCKYGDGHKQVLLTEVGFTDCGDERREEVQAGYTKKILEIAASLPYVRTIYNFRLLEETGMLKKEGIDKNQIGGLPEVYFGFFEEPDRECRPRKKAFVLQKAAGGQEDLTEAGKRVSRQMKGGIK